LCVGFSNFDEKNSLDYLLCCVTAENVQVLVNAVIKGLITGIEVPTPRETFLSVVDFFAKSPEKQELIKHTCLGQSLHYPSHDIFNQCILSLNSWQHCCFVIGTRVA
jgi:hypothetical protein